MIQKKVCLLGASGVGKTSLVRRYVEGIFSDKYLTSIGVKIDKKRVELNGTQAQLMLWDIEGVDRYSGFNAKYLRGASAIIIVVDQTRTQSLHDGIEICRMAKGVAELPVALVVNKMDLPSGGAWQETLKETSAQWFDYQFDTSAKTGDGVEAMFLGVAQLALKG